MTRSRDRLTKLTFTEMFPIRREDWDGEQYVAAALAAICLVAILVGFALVAALGRFSEASIALVATGGALGAIFVGFGFLLVGAEDLVMKKIAKEERLEVEGVLPTDRNRALCRKYREERELERRGA